jgi:predicted cobalt transporter CbtA
MRDRRYGDPARQSTVAVAWIVLIAIGFVVLPGSPDAVTAPATLIWRFRLASAGGALVLWCVTGVVFGALSLTAARRRDQVPAEMKTEVTSKS